MKLLVVISGFLFFAVSCSNPKPPAGENATVDGQVIFENNCVLCHGGDGARGVGGATNLATSVLDHPGVLNVIMNGRQGMKAYKEILLPDEIEAVTTYVESLRKK